MIATAMWASAANTYQSFINQLQAQSGVGVDPTAAAIMIADAQYYFSWAAVEADGFLPLMCSSYQAR